MLKNCAAFGLLLLCSTASAFLVQPCGRHTVTSRPVGSSISRLSALPRVGGLRMALETKSKMEADRVESKAVAKQETVLSWQEMMSSSKEDIYSYVKSYGPAGIASIIIVGGVFWAMYIPVIIFSYHQATGEWISPQLILFPVGATKVAVTALGFWSLARVLFPLRMAAAVAITPTVKAQLFDRFAKKDPQAQESE